MNPSPINSLFIFPFYKKRYDPTEYLFPFYLGIKKDPFYFVLQFKVYFHTCGEAIYVHDPLDVAVRINKSSRIFGHSKGKKTYERVWWEKLRHAKGQLILKVFKQTLYVKGDQWMPNEEAEKMIDQDIADETQKRFDSTLSDCETLYGGNLFGTTPSFYFIPIVWQYPGQLIRPMSHYVLAH